MKKSKKNRLAIVVILILLLVLPITMALTACSGGNEEVPPKIFVVAEDKVRPNEFSLDNAVLVFEYSDGTREEFSITPDMLPQSDLAKLETAGKHIITVNYDDEGGSVQAVINLLKDTTNNAFFDKVIQGIQLAAPERNINGEFEISLYHQFDSQDRKEYKLRLKFTLDVDKNMGDENYLELEILDNDNVLFGGYYKDDTTNRPYFYIKVGGILAELTQEATQARFPSASSDEIFGIAKTPSTTDELMTFDGIIGSLMSILGDRMIEIDLLGQQLDIPDILSMVIGMLFENSAVAVDGSVAAVDINFQTLVDFIPALSLIRLGEVDEFLASIDIPVGLSEILTSFSHPALLKLRALFDTKGGINKFEILDSKGNTKIDNVLHIEIPGVGEVGININKFSITADESYFNLPTNRGLNDFEEGDIPFERWVVDMTRLFTPVPHPSNLTYKDGIDRDSKYYDIGYNESGRAGNNFNKLDIFRPASQSGELPVIIYIHGGGWTQGDKTASYDYCQYLALQGFAVVNINYHLLPYATLPVPIQDIFDAFNFVMDEDNAVKYGFDLDNIFLTGDSAGGHYSMLAMSVLIDEELSRLYGVNSDINFRGMGVSSTGFSFTDVVKIPLPFAHFYVNQFFTDEPPYTAYRDNPMYIKMAESLNLENNKLEDFPPIFVSSAHGDLFRSHSDMLVNELIKRGKVEGEDFIYDFRYQNDKDNPENSFLGHDFNISLPDLTVSRAVNDRMLNFFKSLLMES